MGRVQMALTSTGHWPRRMIAMVVVALLLGSVTAGAATGSPRKPRGGSNATREIRAKRPSLPQRKGCDTRGRRRLCVGRATLNPLVDGNGATQLTVSVSVKDTTPYRDNLLVYLARKRCESSYARAERYVNSVGLSALVSDQGVGTDLTSAGQAGTVVFTTGGRGSSFHAACALIYTTRGGNPSGGPHSPSAPITHPTYVHAGRSIVHGPPVKPIGASPNPCATNYYCAPA